MRPDSQKLQHSIRPKLKPSMRVISQILAAMSLALVTVLYTPAAFAGTEVIEGQGRRIQIGPKGLQVARDGIAEVGLVMRDPRP